MVIHAPCMACTPDIGVESGCQLVPEPSRLMGYGPSSPSKPRLPASGSGGCAPAAGDRRPPARAKPARTQKSEEARASGDATRKADAEGAARQKLGHLIFAPVARLAAPAAKLPTDSCASAARVRAAPLLGKIPAG